MRHIQYERTASLLAMATLAMLRPRRFARWKNWFRHPLSLRTVACAASTDDYVIKPSKADELVALLAHKLASRQPKARILSVSYDEVLLATRHLLLEYEGYEVISIMGLAATLEKCKEGKFDLFVLGHSIDYSEKCKMVEAFRATCPAPIISLRRSQGEQPVDGAEYHIDPDPESLLTLIAQITLARSAAKESTTSR